MRNNWARDIADFAKYGLLKRLAGTDLMLGVFWYLTTHAEANKPLVGYLSKPDAYRVCDCALFDTLRRLHNAKRDALTLEDIEREDVLPRNTVFYRAPLSTTSLDRRERRAARQRWFDDGYRLAQACDLIFLDPDTGLLPSGRKAENADGEEYATIDEVISLCRRGQSVVCVQFWEAHIKASTLLAKITPALIEDVKLRRTQDVAHTTVDKDLAVLKAFFNWCMARSLAASNPVCRIKFFNEDNSRLRYLTEDEYKRLIQAAKAIETSPFLAEKIILSVHTGLRRGSLFHMRWESVDFLNRVVRIPRTKSGRPHALPLNATVLTTLQALYTERLPGCPYVFAHATGRKAGKPVKDVKNGFHSALEMAEIKDFTWHDLRHTFASWLIMKGASLRSVAELLGHRGLRMVMRYAHLSPAYLSAEVGLLDAPTAAPPPTKRAHTERARKGQRAAKRDQRPAKVIDFPKESGSSGWTRTSNPPVNSLV